MRAANLAGLPVSLALAGFDIVIFGNPVRLRCSHSGEISYSEHCARLPDSVLVRPFAKLSLFRSNITNPF